MVYLIQIIKKMKNLSKAMTFAEVLLVVGIIGTIAILSLPGLKKHSQMSEMGRLAQKSYQIVEEAMENAILTHGSMTKWKFDDNKYFCETYLAPNVKTVEVNCGDTAAGDYFLDNNYIISTNGIKFYVRECSGSYCHVHVDVNSSKLPNKYGKDQFEFAVYKKQQKVTPYCPVERWLRANDWRFTKTVWDCNAGCNTGLCGVSYPGLYLD